MNRSIFAIVGSLVIVVLLLFSLRKPERSPASAVGSPGTSNELMIFCAASNRAVMEAIRADYEQEYEVEVQVQYGPSQTLLSSIEVARNGDLYLPADDSYLKIAREKNLIEESLPLATMQAVVAVKKGNPKGIQSFDDLLHEDVRLVQANPDVAAIGNLTRETLSKSGQWTDLQEHTRAHRPTVTDVANDVKVGAADATIVFDAVLTTYEDLEAVSLPELSGAQASIAVGVVSSSKQPTSALHFARYLAARDRGLAHYQKLGFTPAEGDEWADVPKLTLYAGSMLRPAIDQSVTDFEKREGIEVTRVYNGCGILVAQMQAGQHPDAYFACDKEFMSQVTELFPESVDVSQNELVIMVEKGNPHKIATLKDLARPGLRVGVGHEKQCAMGWITQRTLIEGGVRDEVMENVTVQTPTGDMLVNQLKAGSLDAAVAYLSNAAGSGDVIDAVRITGIPCSQAIQPFAVAENSQFKQLAARLYERLIATESRERFLQEGFRWNLEEGL